MKTQDGKPKDSETVFSYHERTKHHPHRYASGPGYLDWANEPDPFRRYEGAEIIELALLKNDPADRHADLYDREPHPFRPFTIENIAAFLGLSMGLSAWK